MSLINYTEAGDAGLVFAGLGSLIIMLVLSYILYRLYIKFVQFIDVLLNREMKYEILEESYLDKIGQKKGIDLNKELIKRKIIETQRKSFRKKLEAQVYDEMFGKTEKK